MSRSSALGAGNRESPPFLNIDVAGRAGADAAAQAEYAGDVGEQRGLHQRHLRQRLGLDGRAIGREIGNAGHICSSGGELDGNMGKAAHLRRMHAFEPRLIDREVAEHAEQLLHCDARLEPRQRGAEAGVQAAAEAEMIARVATDVVALGMFIFALVAVWRR